MRVLQLIDSLQLGGAERMAINIANILSESDDIEGSYIGVTREEGLLKESISEKVKYLFLSRKRTLDFRAIKKLVSYTKKNQINIIHAHSSSFFLATIVKILNRKVKIIWHDHLGSRVYEHFFNNLVIRICSVFFYKVFVVDDTLREWSEKKMFCKNIIYLPNFSVISSKDKQTFLKGVQGKRIICLANLRDPKNHMFLFKAFSNALKTNKEWSLHLIGEDFNDAYSKELKQFIKNNNLAKQIFIYGKKTDVKHILSQGDIGVLPSKSEGLPLSLLEYGLASLAVIATKVGDCNKVITNEKEGRLIKVNSVLEFTNALEEYMNNDKKRKDAGQYLFKRIVKDFNSEAVLDKLICNYKN